MRRLHPSTVVIAFLPEVVKAVKASFPFLFVAFLSRDNQWEELIAPLIGVLSGFGAISAYLTTRYGVEDGSLVLKRGWLFRQDRRIPLEQIHNVNVRQGLLERLLKVVTLEVETAAGQGAELKLQVITAEAADILRAEILPTGSQVPAESKEERHEISRDDLLLGGVSENHGGSIFGYLISIFFGGAAISFLEVELAILKALPWWVPWLLGFTLLALVLTVGWIVGFVSHCLKFGHFAVVNEPGRYRISHGVLTKHQYVVRLARLENVVMQATLWQRLMRRCNLSIGTAGSFGEQGTLAPVALMLPDEQRAQRIASVLPEVDLQSLDWRPLPKRYFWVLVSRWMITTGALLTPLFLAQRASDSVALSGLLWVALIGSILLLVSSLLGLIRAGFVVSDRIVASRYGYFTQTTTIMPLDRIERVSTSQPPFWRRTGMVSLDIKAMVHSVSVPMLPSEVVENLVDRMTELSRGRQASHLSVEPQADPGEESPI